MFSVIRNSLILQLITSTLIRGYRWITYKILGYFAPAVETRIQESFGKAGIGFAGDGVKEQPFGNGADMEIQVHRNEFFVKVATYANLGMGEAYMDSLFDCDDIEELFYRILTKGLFLEWLNPWNRFLNYVELIFFNIQANGKGWEVGKRHYDLGNDLFSSFLDPFMNYSCGYWKDAESLEEAQINKMELIAQKLKLKPGMRVLDIGCGWGGLCKYLAEKHSVECVGITISEMGVKYGRKFCEGLPVEFRLIDYRDLNEQFDRVVSVGMFEHVGHNNYKQFFQMVSRCLKPEGIFLLHTIGSNDPQYPSCESFTNKYIFQNSYLPTTRDVTGATEPFFWILEDWHNLSHNYYKTLMAWKANFDENWPSIEGKYGDRFYRMWSYYLLSAAACFRSRKFQLWQIVMTKGIEGGYQSVR